MSRNLYEINQTLQLISSNRFSDKAKIKWSNALDSIADSHVSVQIKLVDQCSTCCPAGSTIRIHQKAAEFSAAFFV